MRESTGAPRAWAAGAFNDLGGPLAAMPAGKLLLAPRPELHHRHRHRVARRGRVGDRRRRGTCSSASGDPSFGSARMLVDAEKRCDLSVAIASPLEVVFAGLGDAGIQVRVANHGSRTCGGTLGTAAPYSLSGPLTVGPLAPGASQLLDLRVAHAGTKAPTGLLPVGLAAPADGADGDNLATVPTRFSYCDAALRRIGPVGRDRRRDDAAVRVRGAQRRHGDLHGRAHRRAGRLAPRRRGRAVLDPPGAERDRRHARRDLEGAEGRTAQGARLRHRRRRRRQPGQRPRRRLAEGDPERACAKASAPRAKGTRYSGKAFAGSGRKVAKGLLKVRRVDVAIQKLGGKGCHWVSSLAGGTKAVKAGRKRACDAPIWMPATGTSTWSLTLQRKLAKGRYRLLTRAVGSDELAEDTFSKKGRNRVDFRIR